jgi:hypothetical protein
VQIHEAPAELPQLVSLASVGNEVIITEAKGHWPISTNFFGVPGLNRGQIWVSEDFDEP